MSANVVACAFFCTTQNCSPANTCCSALPVHDLPWQHGSIMCSPAMCALHLSWWSTWGLGHCMTRLHGVAKAPTSPDHFLVGVGTQRSVTPLESCFNWQSVCSLECFTLQIVVCTVMSTSCSHMTPTILMHRWRGRSGSACHRRALTSDSWREFPSAKLADMWHCDLSHFHFRTITRPGIDFPKVVRKALWKRSPWASRNGLMNCMDFVAVRTAPNSDKTMPKSIGKGCNAVYRH